MCKQRPEPTTLFYIPYLRAEGKSRLHVSPTEAGSLIHNVMFHEKPFVQQGRERSRLHVAYDCKSVRVTAVPFYCELDYQDAIP
jgi:hypothetical protein